MYFFRYSRQNLFISKMFIILLPFLWIFPLHAQEKNPTLYQTAAQIDAKIGMLSNKKANIIFRIPTQKAYGFIGNAETPEQKATVDNVVDKVKQNISNIVSVDPSLECKYEVNDISTFSYAEADYEKSSATEKQKIKSEYKVLKVDFTLNCEKKLLKQKINVNFSQDFKDISKILIHVKSKQKRKFVIEGASGSFNM